MPPLATTLAGIELRSPLIAAAGTCGYIEELPSVLDARLLGAITTKSITAEPREGNAPWRLIDVPHAMLNAIGLANVGMERFMADKLPAAANVDTVIIGSIAGHSMDDYLAVASAFDESPHLPMVELNVSCPNTSDGLQFGEHPEKLRELLRAVRPVLKQTKMIVKLSPNVGDITSMAQAAVDEGADALTLINTVSAMAIDVQSCKPRLSRGSGGLSGPAIHPIAVRMVFDVYRHVAKPSNIPIIGLGGVLRWEDAAELILAGATAVGIGTGLFIDPTLPRQIHRHLQSWVQQRGMNDISELVGLAHDS
jgi:dihydroorotate dehydrogenase (NAD+) catalytic subunit